MSTDKIVPPADNSAPGPGVKVSTTHVVSSSATTTHAVTGYTVVRTKPKGGNLRFVYDLEDATRQRENFLINRGPITVSTEKD